MLGISTYIGLFICIDYYYLDLTLRNFPFSVWNLGIKIFFVATLYFTFLENIQWTKAREQSRLENLKLQAEYVDTQFNLLIQQVNPDFLFHCLSTLQNMVAANDSQVEDYILKLADVYRQTLKKEQSDVRLYEELAFFKSYMFLMMYGQEKAISFDVNIPPSSLNYHLPIFSLQLLGENYIKNNAFSPNHPLLIRLYQKGSQNINIASNYQPKQTTHKDFDVHIDNLKMRYALAGIEEAVPVEQNENIYATTLKLF